MNTGAAPTPRRLISQPSFIGPRRPLIMKTKLLRMLAGINANVLVALGIASLVAGPALATTLTITPLQNLPPRVMTTQQTHYVRFAIDFGDCPLRAADTACSYRVASLPYNPTTSATIAFGTSGQSAGLMAAFNVFTGQATTAVYDTSFTGAGELVTGANATPTGQNGGFDIYATYTVGAAGSQGTQGRAIFIIQYIAPNDGDCISVPLGATAPSC